MDRILLEGMSFFGYHGDLQPERELGTRFLVDVALGCDLRAAAAGDDLKATVDYVHAYQCVREVVENGPAVNLLETLAERLASSLLALPHVVEATVRVRKQPPLRGGFEHFGVEVTRRKAD